ncbi:MAG: LuxR C-terminal-related transcriptional regulator [Pseudomonadota bacterium]
MMMKQPMADTQDQPNWISQDQLRIPSAFEAAVIRSELCEALYAERDRKGILVTAPAGFGKTTLLVQFAEHARAAGDSVAWLTITEEAENPYLFAAMLAFSCGQAGLDLGQTLVNAEEGFPETSLLSVAQQISSSLKRHGPTVIIIDDYERIQNGAANTFISSLLKFFPSQSQLVLSSRETIRGDFPAYLADGSVVNFNASALTLKEEETRQILKDICDDGTVDTIIRRTEGWPVAVQLSRIFLDANRGASLILDDQSGDHDYLATYLTERVLSNLTHGQLHLLTQVSIVDHFDISLTNYICGIDNSSAMIAQLDWLKPLFGPVHTGSAKYRIHPLLREHLRKLVANNGEENRREVEARASHWYELNNVTHEAVRHARNAGDFDRCAQLIEQSGGWRLVLYGGTGMLRQLLSYIPLDLYTKYPRIALARSYLTARDGKTEEARVMLATIDTGLDGERTSDQALAHDYRAVSIQVLEYADRLTNTDGLELLERYAHEAPDHDYAFKGVLGAGAALIALGIGDLNLAEKHAASGLVAMRQAESTLGLNFLYIHAGNSAFLQGKFDLASANFEEALRMAEENYGADSNLKLIATIFFEGIEYWLGHWDGQDDRGQFSKAVLSDTCPDGWFESFAAAMCVQIDKYIHSGNVAEAERFLKKCDAAAHERRIKRQSLLMKALRLRLEVAKDNDYDSERLCSELLELLPSGVWREHRELWRPYFEAYYSMAVYRRESDPQSAALLIEDTVSLSREINAVPLHVLSLVQSALIYAKIGDQATSDDRLSEAIMLAAPRHIFQPFIAENTALDSLMRNIVDKSDREEFDLLARKFVRRCGELLSERRLHDKARDQQNLLTTRELDVIIALSDGLSNKRIARRLNMTPHTVKFHLKNIYLKLSVGNRSEAIIAAQRAKILRS